MALRTSLNFIATTVFFNWNQNIIIPSRNLYQIVFHLICLSQS